MDSNHISFPAKQHIVLGGLGFIGSRLVHELLRLNQIVLVIDNESLGSVENLISLKEHPNITIISNDALEESTWHFARDWAKTSETLVWHFAANSDIAAGSSNSKLDVRNTFLTSVHLSEFIPKLNCKGVVFASSSAVYGGINASDGFFEDQACMPQSYYGATKLASEHLLGIALSRLAIPFWIFRFANIVGSPATHGVIYDLLQKLSKDKIDLQILGDGKQRKTYLGVSDLISSMFTLVSKSEFGTWNLGPGDDGIAVAEIVEILIEHVAPNARLHFGTDSYGWLGDIPIAKMNCSKLESTIGKCLPSSHFAVHSAIHEIALQLEMSFVCHSV